MNKRGFNYAEAVSYLGVKKDFFNQHIKPRVKWTRAGTCSIADRVDLDRAWDEYVAEKAANDAGKGTQEWRADRPVSTKTKKASGKSTPFGDAIDFADRSARILALRREGSSSG